MWARASLLALLAAGLLGCSSQDDAGRAGAAGESSAGSGATNGGSTSDGGRMAASGAAGRAGASASGGVSGNEVGGNGGGGDAGQAGNAGSAGAGGSGKSCPAPILAGDHAHLDAKERVETYAVSGTTAQELRQSINANRGRDYDALTTWNIDWSFQDCSTPKWSVALDVVYSMPNWDAPPSADGALVTSWQTYLDALYCHEYGHGKIGLDCANAIYDALAALQGTGDCDALMTAGAAQFQGVLDGCKAREIDYDATTNHGATMGAVFPP